MRTGRGVGKQKREGVIRVTTPIAGGDASAEKWNEQTPGGRRTGGIDEMNEGGEYREQISMHLSQFLTSTTIAHAG